MIKEFFMQPSSAGSFSLHDCPASDLSGMPFSACFLPLTYGPDLGAWSDDQCGVSPNSIPKKGMGRTTTIPREELEKVKISLHKHWHVSGWRGYLSNSSHEHIRTGENQQQSQVRQRSLIYIKLRMHYSLGGPKEVLRDTTPRECFLLSIGFSTRC